MLTCTVHDLQNQGCLKAVAGQSSPTTEPQTNGLLTRAAPLVPCAAQSRAQRVELLHTRLASVHGDECV